MKTIERKIIHEDYNLNIIFNIVGTIFQAFIN
jgi:hypothetical protein